LEGNYIDNQDCSRVDVNIEKFRLSRPDDKTSRPNWSLMNFTTKANDTSN